MLLTSVWIVLLLFATSVLSIPDGSTKVTPFELGPTNPLHWLQRSILSIRRWSLSSKIIHLEAPPSDDERPVVNLLVFPGGFKGPESYVELCKEIQRQASQRGLTVHVGIASFFQNAPFLLSKREFKDQEDALQDALPSKPDATFVLGHSLGGSAASLVAGSYKYNGVIMLSSVCNSAGQATFFQQSLSSYPKPILQVMGTRDGCLNHLHLADELECLQRDIERRTARAKGPNTVAPKRVEEMALLEKPIVALEEVTHMHMADGMISKFAKSSGRSDLSSSITIEEAHDRVAATVCDFLASQILTGRGQEESKKSLLQKVRHTMELLRPYRQLSDPSFVSQFLESIQSKMLNLKRPVRVSSRWHDSRSDLVFSKPSLYSEGDIAIEFKAQDPIRLSKHARQKSPTIAIKCKTQDAVVSHSKGGLTNGPPLSLAEMNVETFRQVLETHVTKEQRDRYEKEGRKLSFLPDRIIGGGHEAGAEWIDSSLGLSVCDETGDIQVQSPLLMTPTDMSFRQFAGMWYGKPLTPAQAYEWIVNSAFMGLDISG